MINRTFQLTAIAAIVSMTGCSTQLEHAANQESKRLSNVTDIATSPIAASAGVAPVGSGDRAEQLAAIQRNMPVLRVATSPWIGSRMVPVTTEDKLPSAFREEHNLNFSEGLASVSLQVMAARLTRLTGVAVRIQPDVYQPVSTSARPPSSLPGPIPLPQSGPLPNGLVSGSKPSAGVDSTLQPTAPTAAEPRTVSAAPIISVDAVDMRWKGTLQGYLNHVTDRLGLAWEYRDNTVVIMRFVTSYYEVAAFPGSTNFGMSSGGSSTGQSGQSGTQQSSTAQLQVQEQGSVDPLVTIEKAVAQMIKAVPGSEVMRSDGSGRIVVKTTREMQAQVRDFVRSENTAMQRQAQIQFDIYSVRTDDLDEQGINWSLVLQTLGNGVSYSLNAPQTLSGALTGGLSVNILNAASAGASANDLNRRLGDSRLIVNLLRQYGNSAQHRPVSLLALNRQWARKASLNTEGYLSETTPGTATANGVGIPGLKTDKVTTGDSYLAMPYILENNTVMLKFGISLSDLLGLFDVTSGTGNAQQKVQVPRISALSDQNTVSMKPGEVMVVTGASRLVSKSDKRTLSDSLPVGAGGSRSAQLTREHFMILIRPVLL